MNEVWEQIIERSALLRRINVRTLDGVSKHALTINTPECVCKYFDLIVGYNIHSDSDQMRDQLIKSVALKLERHILSGVTPTSEQTSRYEQLSVFVSPVMVAEMSKYGRWSPSYQLPPMLQNDERAGEWDGYPTYVVLNDACVLVDTGHLYMFNPIARIYRSEEAVNLEFSGFIGCSRVEDFSGVINRETILKP